MPEAASVPVNGKSAPTAIAGIGGLAPELPQPISPTRSKHQRMGPRLGL